MFLIVQHDEAKAEILHLLFTLSLCSNPEIMLQTDDFFISWIYISYIQKAHHVWLKNKKSAMSKLGNKFLKCVYNVCLEQVQIFLQPSFSTNKKCWFSRQYQ